MDDEGAENCTMEFKPIGHIESGFKFKNGTPRQPTVCGSARARLTINTDTYSNPEHSLEGLDQFSHVWVIFVFHKNNNPYVKAKVKPPRLNGAKVGVFSTRSPYRLNPIGLTLAKIEEIEGATVHLSGVDMLDGTPVLDIKPYIPLYDKPQAAQTEVSPIGPDSQRLSSPSEVDKESYQSSKDKGVTEGKPNSSVDTCKTNESNISHDHFRPDPHQEGGICSLNEPSCSQAAQGTDVKPGVVSRTNSTSNSSEADVSVAGHASQLHGSPGIFPCVSTEDESIEEEGNVCQDQDEIDVVQIDSQAQDEENQSQVEFAEWIQKPPFHKLSVRWTPTAEDQLHKFSVTATDDRYKLEFIKSTEEARKAVEDILHADPRSSYRRRKCVDRLYFFMVDVLHVTCWFNDDESVAEVVRVKPNREKMLQKLAGYK